ncbi:Non-specific serine/threonine protein kinase [Bertholletia excelsa]
MRRIFNWVLLISLILFLPCIESVDDEIKKSLLNFYRKLSNSEGPVDPGDGWNTSSDPCNDHWKGIVCDNWTNSVRNITLNGLKLAGALDANTLCSLQSLAASLTSLRLNDNLLRGENIDQIADCSQLNWLYIGGNRFSGSLPTDSVSKLKYLKGLNISGNNFSGTLANLEQISGLQVLLAENNQLTGQIPSFNFTNFLQFNVSYNNLTGRIPQRGHKFQPRSYYGNPELCGDPLPNKCMPSPLPAPAPQNREDKGNPKYNVVMFLGFFLVGFILFLLIAIKLCSRGKKEDGIVASTNLVLSGDDNFYKKQGITETKASKSEAASAEVSTVPSSSIVLTSPEVNGLRFENLLKAPAQLLGGGKHGTVYRILTEEGINLVVKRIGNWPISATEFGQRMKRLDQVKHPNVMPALAYYCSQMEKLLVYKYRENGNLSALLLRGEVLAWSRRLRMAATIADALAFMHRELQKDGIAHGNLKSSNILINKNMEPVISEYGLVRVDPEANCTQVNNAFFQLSGSSGSSGAFKADVYALGVILLELLTGKMGRSNGAGLTKWVVSVVREEWTVEVFDRRLIRAGASEERMINLLQVAVKCIDGSPESRPSVEEVAVVINTIREEEERSVVSET